MPTNAQEKSITAKNSRFLSFFRFGVGSSAYFERAAKNRMTNTALRTAVPAISAMFRGVSFNISSPIHLFLLADISDAAAADRNNPAPNPAPKAMSRSLKSSITAMTAAA